MLDNSPNAMLASYTQCLPMTNFYFSAQDDELRKALLHLKMMAKHADARVYLKNFNVEKYTEPILNAGPQPVQL